MTIQSQGVRTTGLTIANAGVGLYPPSTVRAAILEFGVIQATGTAQSLGLGRPATIGTPTTNLLMQTDDPADSASVVPANLTWSAQPTAPTAFHRRWNSAATIGVGCVWSFPLGGLVIAASGAVVLWNITAAVASDVNIAIDA
jgi:hypothetical protein